MEPMCLETFLAASKSGEPSSPTEKECNCGHHADWVSSDSIRLEANFLANAEVTEESNPPDNKTP